MMQGLSAQNITFSYAGSDAPVLKDFSLDISAGSITLISGASGCGKSTVCSLFSGIYPRHGGTLERGHMLCDGQSVNEMSIAHRAALVGMMFQNPDLQFCMDTVENELIFCLENISTDPSAMPVRIAQALAFSGIEHLRHRKLHTLSGGEKQKTALACIVALGSRYIVLDEPFANVDSQSSQMICRRLCAYQREKNATLLIVDHDLTNFIDVADEVIVLGEAGKILLRGINAENLSEYTQKLADMGISVPGIPYDAPPKNENAAPNAILSLKDVKTGYDGAEILHGASADFMEGTITAITGASGGGKSTLLMAMARMTAFRGRIVLNGQPITKLSRKRYGRQLGIAFQNPQDQFVANTVYDEIALSLHEPSETKVRSILEPLGLWVYRNRSPYMLSQGQQRRLAVGALLAYECKVLLCDEPTYGQDRRSAQCIMNLLRDRVNSGALTVIFTTHDVRLAKAYADQHLLCKDGKLFAIQEENYA